MIAQKVLSETLNQTDANDDDFATRDRLVRTLSRDRAKDMASDYEQVSPAQSYAKRRGITFRERMVEIVRRVVPEKLRDKIGELLKELRSPAEFEPGQERGLSPGRAGGGTQRDATSAALGREIAARDMQRETDAPLNSEAELRSARTRALVRHARALEAVVGSGKSDGQGTPELMQELRDARNASRRFGRMAGVMPKRPTSKISSWFAKRGPGA